jgi:CHASE2 domain-containing sensor protein
VFTVPFVEGRMPGIQVHANVIDNLLSQRFMRPLGAGWNLVMLVACALVVGIAGAALDVWPAAGIAALVVVAIGWASLLAFGQGVWMAAPVLAVAFATFRAWPTSIRRRSREGQVAPSRFVSKDA